MNWRLLIAITAIVLSHNFAFSQSTCVSSVLNLTVMGGETVVVNAYYPGSSTAVAGSTTINVGTKRTIPGAFTDLGGTISNGDLLMVIQMQGAEIDPTIADAEVTITTAGVADLFATTDYGDGPGGLDHEGFLDNGNYIAGQYEFVVATDLTAGVLTIQDPLTNSYINNTTPTSTIGRRVFQVVKVGNYNDLTVDATGEITTVPWNGTTGGIISIDALGTFNLNGTIDLDFAGFRGGYLDLPGGENGDEDNGYRGEGIVGTPTQVYGYNDDFTAISGTTGLTLGYPGGSETIFVDVDLGGVIFNNQGFTWDAERGQGAPGNAGGGGFWNNGGGGGSTGGGGGNGAAENFLATGGGAPIDIENGSLLTLGGGGGSGGQTDLANDLFPVTVNSGRPGGGAIIIRADVLQSTGATGIINANGDDGGSFNATASPSDPDEDGSGGGGGAGGTVIVITSSEDLSDLTINATGGDGADLTGIQQYLSPDGGGGGGSGGNVMLVRRGGEFTATATIDVSGGAAGQTQGTPSANSTGGDGAVTLLTTPPASNLDCPLITSVTAAPGGVSDAILWFRTDQDVTFNGSNQVSAWNDFSTSNFTMTNTAVTGITGGTPDYVTGSFTDAEASSNRDFNFNPSISFSDPTDYLAFTNFTNISTSAITVFAVTNFATGSANDQTIYSYLPNDSQDDEFDLGITDDSGGDGIRERVLDNSADAAGDIRDDVTRIIAADYDNTDANIWVNNGAASNTALSVGTLETGGTFVLGQDLDDFTTPAFDGTRDLEGQVGDIIYFSRILTATERQEVFSYLAIKYGITLDQTSAQDYLSSVSDPIFPASTESATYGTYDNDIAGIGRDDGSGLSQLRSKSVNSDAILSASHTDGFTIDRQFLVWGNNNGILTFNTTEISTGITNRIQREWRVATTNSPDPVDLTFDLSSSTGATTITNTPAASANLALVIDDDGDFSNGFLRTVSFNTWDGSTAVFNDVTINDDEVITLAVVPDAPGGVSGLVLWLKADAGVTTVGGDGTEVTQWNDQSGAGSNFASQIFATPAEIGPTFTASDGNFNSNPSFDFTDNYLAVDDYGQFPSATDFTFISAQRADATATAAAGALIGYGEEEFDIREMDAITIEVDNGNLDFGADADIRSQTTTMSFQWDEGNGAADAGYLFIGGAADGGNPIAITEPNIETVGQDFVIGQEHDNADDAFEATDNYIGQLGEILLYNTFLSDTDREKVESYLAIKYGITLDGDEADYIASDGNFIYETVVIPADYNNDIAGIGRDDISTLDQRSSISNNTDAIVTMALTDDGGTFGSPNAFTANLSFLAWGNDNDDNGTIAEISTELPSNTSTRLDREWRVQEKGTVGQVTMTFNLTGITVTGTTASDFLLLIDDGGDFSNGINRSIEATSFASNVVTFEVDFTDGEIFTLGTSRPATGPGNITTNLRLWLRADRGVTGDPVTAWADQSVNGFDAAPFFGTAVNQATVSSGIFNNNDALTFDGTDGVDVYTMAAMTDDPSTADLSLYTVFQQPIAATEGLISQVGTPNPAAHLAPFTDGTVVSSVSTTLSFSTATLSTTSPNIAGYTLSGTNVRWYLDGVQDASLDDVVTVTSRTGVWAFGSANDGSLAFNGSLGEVVAYRQALSAADRNRVESYLAIKYGRTLDAGNSDYTSAGGDIVYPASSDANFSGFVTDIAGIGRDDLSDFEQTISSSTNSTSILTVTKSAGFDTDGQYFMWGSNGTAIGSSTTADVPSGTEARIERVWKLKLTNSPTGVIDVALDLTGVASAIQEASDLRLIVDADDGDFSNATVLSTVPTESSNVYTFSGIDLSNFPDESFFTLASTDEANTPLPIQLTDFRAFATGRVVQLEWQTSQEVNNEKFVVERTRDFTNWEAIAEIEGAGNSSEVNNYQTTDEYPFIGYNYYRLRQVDFDGKETLSKVLTVAMQLTASEIDVFPNPSSGFFRIRSLEEDLSSVEIRVTSVSGKQFTPPISMSNQSTIEMDLSTFNNGIYLLEVISGNRVLLRQRLVKGN